MDWKDHNKWEQSWWHTCQNTYWEETKQRVYARKMGLQEQGIDGKFPVYDLKGASCLDIGGGPTSLLLKCINGDKLSVVDPCEFPQWIYDRYRVAGIDCFQIKAEDIIPNRFPKYEQIWIYNCLQHTDFPFKIIRNARKMGKIIRIFEWIDTYVSPGHPHVLTEDKLNEWLGGEGKVETLNESGCHGKAYYGIFKGDHYEKV